LHVFPFSPRDGTAAVHLPNPVPQRISGERSRELRELAQAKGGEYRAKRVGGRAEVVVEGAGGTALTGDYLRVGVGVDENVRFEMDQAVSPDAAALTRAQPRIPSGTLQGDADHLYIAWSRDPALIST
jgi:tRNA A37 methylthiotransferase MiaB